MCSASVSALNVDSPRTTSPIASLTTSSKRDMCAPFWFGAELDDALEARREQLLGAVLADADHLLDAGDADARQAQLDGRALRLDVDRRSGMRSARQSSLL